MMTKLTYRRVATILHPVSLTERPHTDETLTYPDDLDFDCLTDAEWRKRNRVTVETGSDGLPTFLEIMFLWRNDFTETVIVRYTRLT
jgi:hypothetical protein